LAPLGTGFIDLLLDEKMLANAVEVGEFDATMQGPDTPGHPGAQTPRWEMGTPSHNMQSPARTPYDGVSIFLFVCF